MYRFDGIVEATTHIIAPLNGRAPVAGNLSAVAWASTIGRFLAGGDLGEILGVRTRRDDVCGLRFFGVANNSDTVNIPGLGFALH